MAVKTQRAYDVYLDGAGFMLAKDGRGGFRPGASQERVSDPFTRYVSEEERHAVQSFKFGGGAGSSEVDGSDRYTWGRNIDTRAGYLVQGPDWRSFDPPTHATAVCRTLEPAEFVIKSAPAATGDAAGWRVNFGASRTVETIGILMRRGVNGIPGGFTMEIRADGATPGAVLADATMDVFGATRETWPLQQVWEDQRLAWHEFILSAPVTAAAFWIVIDNSVSAMVDLFVACDDNLTGAEWAENLGGAGWAVHPTWQFPAYYRAEAVTDGIDAFVRDIKTHRPYQGERELYAAVGNKVMRFDSVLETWVDDLVLADNTITELHEYDENLLAATGNTEAFWRRDVETQGAVAPWVQEAAEFSDCFATHDNLIWIAWNGSSGPPSNTWGCWLKGAKTLGGGFEDAEGLIGDPVTPIMKMVSHGGKLFAIKPEGLYEITYPDGYPSASQEPFGNLLIDYTTERDPRGFLRDWHSGLYYPSDHGLYRYQNGVIEDVWRRLQEEDTDRELPRRYDGFSGGFLAAANATRALFMAQSQHFIDEGGHAPLIWSYDGLGGFHPHQSEPDAYGERSQAVLMSGTGGGEGVIVYGHGYEIRVSDWPTWTDDRSRHFQAQPGSFYQGEGMECVLPLFTGKDRSELKSFSHAVIHLDQIGQGVTEAHLYADIDGTETEWTAQSTDWSGPVMEYRPAAAVEGYGIRFRIELVEQAAAYSHTIRIRQVDLFYQALPELVRQFELVLQVSDRQRLHSGALDDRTAGEMITELRALLDGQAVIPFVDELAQTFDVRLVGMTKQAVSQYEVTPGAEGFKAENLVALSMLEVA